VEPQRLWINPVDAKVRDISDWDDVRVFNDRGVTVIPARVTETVMPEVVYLGEGAWFSPDENGVDRGGCPNVLTKDEYSPGGAFCCNTCLVQVEKA
jgi:anaerobic dimethyl sulfoxide reductase subunit A